MSKHTIQVGLHMDQDPDNTRSYWVSTGHLAVKHTLAKYLNAKTTNLALVPNASIGLNLLIHSLDNQLPTLVLEHEYPSVSTPFDLNMRSVTRLSFSVTKSGTKDLIEMIDRHKPGIVAISWVQWLSGFKVDLDELCTYCREQGIITCIDVTQALGAFPLSVADTKADIVFGSGYKWLLAGFGNAFIYLSDAILDGIKFKVGGFNSYDFNGDSYSFNESIRCLEPGHLDHVSFMRLSAALDEILTIGTQEISNRVTALTNLFITELNKLGIEHLSSENELERSGIVSVNLTQNQYDMLRNEDIRFIRRMGFARFGWHFYNMEEEVLRVVDLIRKSR